MPVPRPVAPLIEAVSSWSEARIFRAAVALVLVLVLLRLTLPPVPFLFLLLGPVALAGWGAGVRRGLALAFLGPFVLWIEDRARGVAPPWEWTTAWEVGSDVAVLSVMAVILARYRARLGQEARIAATDPLTDLPNRGAFLGQVEDEIARSSRYGYVFSLVYVDLDGFKAVNDVEGHDAGDAVLRRVADALRASTRQTDALGRLGGDEFAALLPHTTVGPAAAVLAKLQENLRAAMHRSGWPVTFSIGAATFETPAKSGRTALQVADEAMYDVKHHGKDGISHVVWDGEHPVREHAGS